MVADVLFGIILFSYSTNGIVVQQVVSQGTLAPSASLARDFVGASGNYDPGDALLSWLGILLQSHQYTAAALLNLGCVFSFQIVPKALLSCSLI